MPESGEAVFELTDIEVETVGLVSAGAVGEDFFLTKKAGKVMTEEIVAVELLDPESKSFWEKMASFFKEQFAQLKAEMIEAQEEEEEEEPEEEEEKQEGTGRRREGYHRTRGPEGGASRARRGQVGETRPRPPEGGYTGRRTQPSPRRPKPVRKEDEFYEEVEMEDTVVTEQQEVVERVMTTQPEVEDIGDVITKIETALAEKYGVEIKQLQTRLEKAEAEAQRVQEDTAEKEMIQKARDFSALPIRYDELGRRLYKLSKALVAEDFEWLTSLLNAVDKQLGAAGILNELGTSKTPDELALEDRVEKVAKEKGIPYDQALLEMPEAEQKQLLAQMRK